MTTVAAPQTIDAADLAAALGLDARSIRRRAIREGWPTSDVSVRGGQKTVFERAKLPADVREDLVRWQSDKAVEEFKQRAGPAAAAILAGTAKPLPVPVPAHEETTAARATRDAREAVRWAVTRIENETCCTRNAAIKALRDRAKSDTTAAATLRLARDDRGRKSADQSDELPSIPTIFRWLATDDLIPKQKQRDMSVKPWMAVAVALKARPQKPTTQSVHDALLESWDMAWGELISYDALTRFFREKFSRMDILKGQHTGSALSAHRFYQHRSSAGLVPAQEVHADGWNTHFTAPHHRTGAFVTFEVWHFHCQSTRYVPRVSVGYTETGAVILKGLENCIRELGIPDLLQTDSTGAVKNDTVEFDPVSSFSKRANMRIAHPVKVGNSQANGCPESFNRYLDHEARELATYQGKHQDSLTLKRVKKLTTKMVAAAKAGDLATRDQLKLQAAKVGKGLVFSTHAEAVAWINAKVDKFNDAPHRSLPKVTDPATGRKVNMTPRQALQQARAAGWQPKLMDEASLVDLFRHHVQKTVRRETVSPYGGQRYSAPELADFNDQEVMVSVDRSDDSKVWVKTLKGALICVADFVEATGFRSSRTMDEIAQEKRAASQIKRREQQIEDIEQRMAPEALEMASGESLTFAGLPKALPEVLAVLNDGAPSHGSEPFSKAEQPQAPASSRPNGQRDFAMWAYGEQAAREAAARAGAKSKFAGSDSYIEWEQSQRKGGA